MANQQKDEQDAPITLTMGALKEMLSALVAEMKKPHVDQDVVARNEAAKLRMRAQRVQSEKDRVTFEDNCTHERPDGTSAIAWHEQLNRKRQLYITEGFCQHCNKHYEPGVEGYAAMLKKPTGKVGLITG
jgi:hypothetical protein